MDDIRKSQVRMLRRFLEKIEQELRIILSEEGDKFKADQTDEAARPPTAKTAF